MCRTPLLLVLAFTFTSHALGQGEIPDLTGDWSVTRVPATTPSSSPFKEWLNAVPTARFSLTPSVIAPLAMIRKDLGYTYFPSLPSVTISQGFGEKAAVVGFLQHQTDRRFEGELTAGGCWIHLSLVLSDDGSTLSGSARINTKISTRQCRSGLAKEVKKGQPFSYGLTRLK